MKVKCNIATSDTTTRGAFTDLSQMLLHIKEAVVKHFNKYSLCLVLILRHSSYAF